MQKRASFRLMLAIDASYTLLNEQGKPIGQPRQASVHNLSLGGIQLHSSMLLPKASQISIDLPLPSDFLDEMRVQKELQEISPFGVRLCSIEERPPNFRSMRLRGAVVGSRTSEATKRYIYHVKFHSMSPQDTSEMTRFIQLRQLYELRNRVT